VRARLVLTGSRRPRTYITPDTANPTAHDADTMLHRSLYIHCAAFINVSCMSAWLYAYAMAANIRIRMLKPLNLYRRTRPASSHTYLHINLPHHGSRWSRESLESQAPALARVELRTIRLTQVCKCVNMWPRTRRLTQRQQDRAQLLLQQQLQHGRPPRTAVLRSNCPCSRTQAFLFDSQAVKITSLGIAFHFDFAV
jgi:hypothetical protein